MIMEIFEKNDFFAIFFGRSKTPPSYPASPPKNSKKIFFMPSNTSQISVIKKTQFCFSGNEDNVLINIPKDDDVIKMMKIRNKILAIFPTKALINEFLEKYRKQFRNWAITVFNVSKNDDNHVAEIKNLTQFVCGHSKFMVCTTYAKLDKILMNTVGDIDVSVSYGFPDYGSNTVVKVKLVNAIKLVEFVEKHGHFPRYNAKTPKEKQLCQFQHQLRHGRLNLEPELGSYLDEELPTWAQRRSKTQLAHARAQVQWFSDNGHLPKYSKFVEEDERKMARILHILRHKYKGGYLKSETVEVLNQIPDWLHPISSDEDTSKEDSPKEDSSEELPNEDSSEEFPLNEYETDTQINKTHQLLQYIRENGQFPSYDGTLLERRLYQHFIRVRSYALGNMRYKINTDCIRILDKDFPSWKSISKPSSCHWPDIQATQTTQIQDTQPTQIQTTQPTQTQATQTQVSSTDTSTPDSDQLEQKLVEVMNQANGEPLIPAGSTFLGRITKPSLTIYNNLTTYLKKNNRHFGSVYLNYVDWAAFCRDAKCLFDHNVINTNGYLVIRIDNNADTIDSNGFLLVENDNDETFMRVIDYVSEHAPDSNGTFWNDGNIYLLKFRLNQ